MHRPRGCGHHARGVLDGIRHGIVSQRRGIDLPRSRDLVGDHAVRAVVRVATTVHVALATLDVGVCTAAQRHHDAAVVLGARGPGTLLRTLRSARSLGRGLIAAARTGVIREQGSHSAAGSHNAHDKGNPAGNGDENPAAHGARALLPAAALGVGAGLLCPGGRLRTRPDTRPQHAHFARRLAATQAAPLFALLHASLGVARGTDAGALLARLFRHVTRDANAVSPPATLVVVLPVCHEPSPIRSRPPNPAFSTFKDSKRRGLQLKPARPPRGAHHATVSSRGASCPR